jgi:hypothetical protein
LNGWHYGWDVDHASCSLDLMPSDIHLLDHPLGSTWLASSLQEMLLVADI